VPEVMLPLTSVQCTGQLFPHDRYACLVSACVAHFYPQYLNKCVHPVAR